MTLAALDLKTLELIVGYNFKNPQLLTQALTHRSYVNENKNTSGNNERLEFLGDAVVEIWASNQLYHQYPTLPEGQLTNLRSLLVRTENLAAVALTIKLGDYLFLSRGEAAHGGRANISLMADTFESLVGAIYVDSNITTVFEFLNKHLLPTLDSISQLKVIKDPKSYFQEICQSQTGVTPHYTIVSQTGPDHARTFEASVMVGDRSVAVGTGNSKQKAEEAAAIAATKVFEK
jgi:ribonuclease-3